VKLVARQVSFRYAADAPAVLSDLSFTAEPGSYWCLAGPNGSGKSTFLKLACGLLPGGRMTGELSWNGKPLPDWTRLELAREIAFVPGSIATQFPVTVEDFVLQGRFARSRVWARATKTDHAVTHKVLERSGIDALSRSAITEISAGELQLAMIARALAQEPRALVLDEATSNLDLRHQARIFELLGELNRSGLTLIVVSHDLNLAAEFCPNALWLKRGAAHAQGTMGETLRAELLRDVYDLGDKASVGKNPFTGKPKVFWNPSAIVS
jgi:iron complex transport system ATP-binding protein